MIVTVPKSGILDIKLFDKMLDISQIVYYSFKENRDGTLHLKFYDNKRKVIKPYAGTNDKEKKQKNKSSKVQKE